MAARYGQVEVIDALIKSGADLEAKDKRGRTALMSAVQSRNTDAVKALLAGGANVDTRDEVQATALFRASGPFGNVMVVGSLLNAGAEVNVSDKNGMTPLMWAVRFGDAPRVKALADAQILERLVTGWRALTLDSFRTSLVGEGCEGG